MLTLFLSHIGDVLPFLVLLLVACCGIYAAAIGIHRRGVHIGRQQAEIEHRRALTVAVLKAKAEGARTERARAGRFALNLQNCECPEPTLK